MSEYVNQLDRLKIKPIPNKENGVNIIFKKEKESKEDLQKSIMDKMKGNLSKSETKSNIDKVENTNLLIVDKTKNKTFNKDDFMKKIRKNRVIQNVTEDEKRRLTDEVKTQKLKTKKTQIEKEKKLTIIDEERTDDITKSNVIEIKTAPSKRKYTKRSTKKIDVLRPSEREIKIVKVGEQIQKRLPSKENMIIMKKSSYYMNNREKFVNFITSILEPYKDEITKMEKEGNCSRDESGNEKNKLFIHQKIVRDYLNLYTPYRGLLLYHGLGSGKTCSSIAIAEGFLHLSSIIFSEGLITPNKVVVMTPASLQSNYKKELRKCGNELYQKNQYWEFIDTKLNSEMVDTLSYTLQLPLDFINSQGGAWFVDVKKPSNYEDLSELEKKSLNEQITFMIDYKYSFINYNGIREARLDALTNNNSTNLFDNKVVIIDEVHNFVSRIVNKIDKKQKGKDGKEKQFLSTRLYHYLMSAQNARIVLLTGTPMINYPNELGILFNILRGYIRVWQIPFENKDHKKTINTNYMRTLFKSLKSIDYIEVSSNTLYITRNPFSFVNRFYGDNYKGVRYDNTKEKMMNDDEFLESIVKLLNNNKIEIVTGKINLELTKALPDKLEQFQELFIDNNMGNIKGEDIFKRRILGLTSYFRSADEKLMPKYDEEKDYHEVNIDMSDYQFGKYQEARLQERKLEKKSKKPSRKNKDNLYSETTSTYRIFSRLFCNFVFPSPPGRPMPNEDGIKEGLNEDLVDGITEKAKKRENNEEINEDDEEVEVEKNSEFKSYIQRIQDALNTLDESKEKYLIPYSDGNEVGNINEDKEEEQIDVEEINKNTAENVIESIKSAEESDDLELLENSIEAVNSGKVQESEEIKTLKGSNDSKIEKSKESMDGGSPTKDGLEKYSPKFLHILENIQDSSMDGCHLLYSQFRTLEGIGIFSLVLQANGYHLLKLKKNSSQQWEINIPEEKRELGKMFALYTGTESAEEKEIIRNIYNGDLKNIPVTILEELKKIAPNNNFGEWIKVFMITSSGAEGIDLKNTRFVHVMEPYWHPVRKEQVIGRARRICSHSNLPEEKRTVQVFLYLMRFTQYQIEKLMSGEIQKNDISKYNKDNKTPQTSDETLHEISNRKETISKQLLRSVKESAMDCSIHHNSNSNETLECYSFGNEVDENIFSYKPNLLEEDRDVNIKQQNEEKVSWEAAEWEGNGKLYAMRLDKDGKPTNKLYDYDSYISALKNPKTTARLVAKIVEKNGKTLLDTNV